MKITQISVFLENQQGRLRQVSEILGAANVNIRALNIAETADYGVLRMVVDRPGEALAALKKGGIVAARTDVVAVEVPDHPGGLARALAALGAAGINVEYMYGFFEKRTDRALLVFRFDQPDAAIATLTRNGFTVATAADMES